MKAPAAPRSLLLRDGRIELDARVVVRSTGRHRLTVNETELLAQLAQEPRDYSRAELCSPGRAIDHLVARLRKKIEVDPADPRHLVTAHGVGYRFVASSGSAAASFPSGSGRFFGRDAELGQIDLLFADGARLVTLVGGPGTGKTRLAIEHARDAAGHGRHATFVDLAGCGSADDMPNALTVAMETPVSDLPSALADASPRIIVLDNAEHLLPGAALHVSRWVARSPQVRWLVTSREALRLQDEARLLVGSLPAGAALEMFSDRARRLGVEVDQTSATVVAICETLERRPLALELAAGRLPALGVDGLAAHLPDQLGTLRTRSRDVPARHSGMWEAVSWSWEQLDADEQSALVACASFRSDFSLEGALAVIGRSDAVELVERLVDRSLVERRDSASTLRLHVPAVVAEVARGLDTALVPLFEERHARWTLAETERAPRPSLGLLHELTAIVSRLGAAFPLLALDAALAAERLFDARLTLDARRALMEQAAVLAASAGPSAALRVAIAQAELASFEGATEEPLAILARAGELAQTERERGRVHLARARVLSPLTPSDGAAEAEIARRIADGCGDAETIMGALHVLGILAREAGDNHSAREMMQRALLTAERLGALREQSVLLIDVANAFLNEGDLQQAAQAYRAAMRIDRDTGDEGREAIAMTNLAFVEHLEGELASARTRHEQALAVHRRLGNRRIAGFALSAFGTLAHELGELAVAERRLIESEEILRGVHPMFQAYTLAALAAVWAELGDRGRAEAAIAEAESLLEPRAAARTHSGLATFRAIVAGTPLTQEQATARDAFGRVGARLHRAVAARRERGHGGGASLKLVVGPDAAWFETADSGRVVLRRRRVLRRILQALCVERSEHPGRPLGLERLIEAGWPGERIQPRAGAARAYTAIRELRRAGLSALQTVADGYLIDPAVLVERSDTR